MALFDRYKPKTPQEKEEAKIFGSNYQLYRHDLDELAVMYKKLEKDKTFLKGTSQKHQLYLGLSEEEIFAVVFGFNMLTYFFQTHKDLPTNDFQLLLFGKFFSFPQKKTLTILKRSRKVFDDYYQKKIL